MPPINLLTALEVENAKPELCDKNLAPDGAPSESETMQPPVCKSRNLPDGSCIPANSLAQRVRARSFRGYRGIYAPEIMSRDRLHSLLAFFVDKKARASRRVALRPALGA